MRKIFRLFRKRSSLIAVGTLGLLCSAWFGVPVPDSLREVHDSTPVVLDRNGTPIAFIADEHARWSSPIPRERMGEHVPRIIVALEDHRFYAHSGIDYRAVFGALATNLRNGKVVRGGSTITQQVVKLAGDETQRGIPTKLFEMAVATRLEREWEKEKILSRYLNAVDFGNRRIGIRAAARTYFHKEPESLSLAEAVYLAGIPRGPDRFNPWNNSEACLERYGRNLERLAESGLLTAGEASSLRSAPPQVHRTPPPRHAPHFVDHLRAIRSEEFTGGLVRTALDLALQENVERILQAETGLLAKAGFRDAAVVVLENETGDILAMVGSLSYRNSQVNAATLYRSSGSTLKPFLYSKAVEERVFTAASVLPDVREALAVAYPDYAPENFDHRFHGPVRLREALGNSLNIPAVYVLSELGARSVFQFVEGTGIRFRRGVDEYGAGWILGNADVRLLDLCGAFTMFANGGEVRRPRALLDDLVSARPAVSAATASIVADILCDDSAREKTFGIGSALDFGSYRVAVKTGTSTAFRDRWCVGANRDHTVGVWIGNVDGSSPRSGELGGAARIWRSVIERLVSDFGSRPLPAPTLEPVEICPITGLLPDSDGVSVPEYFLPDTAPTRAAETMMTDGRTLLLPEIYRAWCHGPHRSFPAMVAPSLDRFAILYPADGSRFSIDPRVRPEFQTLRLRTNREEKGSIAWSVDGRPLEGDEWKLATGRHVIKARKTGSTPQARPEADSVTITVGDSVE